MATGYLLQQLTHFEANGWNGETIQSVVVDAKRVKEEQGTWDAALFGTLLRRVKRLKKLALARNKGKEKEACDGEDGYRLFVDCWGKVQATPLMTGVASVSCGAGFVIARMVSGEAFSWGVNSFAQLGHEDTEPRACPEKIKYFETTRLAEVACGHAFAIFKTIDDDLFACGSNGGVGIKADGRMGVGRVSSTTEHNYLARIPCSGLHDIVCGSTHGCALTCEDRLVAWGHCVYAGHNRDVYEPMIVDRLAHLRWHKVSIGPGGYHTVATTRSGKVYTWGHNRCGQLGWGTVGARSNYIHPVPAVVTGLPIDICVVEGVAGWGHTMVLTDNGDVYVCGRNVEFQLGIPKSACSTNGRGHRCLGRLTKLTRTTARRPTPASTLVAGGGISGILTESNELYTWGDSSMECTLENTEVKQVRVGAGVHDSAYGNIVCILK